VDSNERFRKIELVVGTKASKLLTFQIIPLHLAEPQISDRRYPSNEQQEARKRKTKWIEHTSQDGVANLNDGWDHSQITLPPNCRVTS
jgi:hypothetical protein